MNQYVAEYQMKEITTDECSRSFVLLLTITRLRLYHVRFVLIKRKADLPFMDIMLKCLESTNAPM
jgi:hypothetical protein